MVLIFVGFWLFLGLMFTIGGRCCVLVDCCELALVVFTLLVD